MARASNIYLVGLGWGAEDMAAFTVKHEAQKYVRRGVDEGWLGEDVEIARLGDNHRRSVQTYTIESFLASR